MAEKLGEALLEIRTTDKGFAEGVAQAEGRAQKLGATLDKTSGSSAKLATEMKQTGQSAAQMSAGFEQAGQRVVQSAGAQRAGMQQLSFQLNDMATMFALGARPMQIFASQSGQVIQSLQLMAGGTSRVASFLGGPWGIAITSAVVVLTPFIGKLFESEQALEKVELASDNLADAQTILGRIFDLTTGKLKDQSAQAKETTTTLLKLAQVTAEGKLREARDGLQAAAGKSVAVGEYVDDGSRAGRSFRTSQRATSSALAAQSALDGNTDGALAYLRKQMDAGRVPPAVYEQVARQILNVQLETQNVEQAKAGLKSVNTGVLDPQFREGGPKRRDRAGPQGPKPRTDAAKQEDFDNQSFNLQRETLQAQLQLATSADDRASIQQQLLNIEREQRVAEIEASDLGAERKAALISQVEALLGVGAKIDEQGNIIVSANKGLEGQVIARERARQQADDEQSLADERFRGQMDMLRNQIALADTQVAQKVIALRIYDAQVEEERLRLQKIIDLEAIGVTTKREADKARQRLADLNANAPSGREVVSQQNETDVERYMRGLNKTPGQINEALQSISIDGLETLNDGLTKAIMGAESLGDVFDSVADQIIAALLRIAIQQLIIQPLANALFGSSGGGGGGGGGIFGTILNVAGAFAGGRATGGTIPTGKFAVVGEEGPELAFAGPGGMGIMSNPDSRKLMSGGGGTSVNMPITIDATGADAAAIARLNSRIEQLREELPARIVTTVREAKDRRILT